MDTVGPAFSSGFASDAEISYWPAIIDMLTTILMCFFLFSFFQNILNVEDLKSLSIRINQERFIQAFKQEFAQEDRDGTVKIEADLNIIQLTFSDQILFASGDDKLQPSGMAVLKRCFDVFNMAKESNYKQIQIEGHSDHNVFYHDTFPRDNWELSYARAQSVLHVFLKEIRRHGSSTVLSRELFSANSYADTRPVDEEDYAKNRRIEIRIFFSTPDERGGADVRS